KWADEKTKEPSDADLRVQAERVAKIYAMSLYEGAEKTFYFILPHYVEGQIQYGALHQDLTPRPAYLALAAVGRLLAGARPIGKFERDGVSGYVFDAKPDGQDRRVIVFWKTKADADAKLTLKAEAVFDCLGRATTLE